MLIGDTGECLLNFFKAYGNIEFCLAVSPQSDENLQVSKRSSKRLIEDAQVFDISTIDFLNLEQSVLESWDFDAYKHGELQFDWNGLRKQPSAGDQTGIDSAFKISDGMNIVDALNVFLASITVFNKKDIEIIEALHSSGFLTSSLQVCEKLWADSSCDFHIRHTLFLECKNHVSPITQARVLCFQKNFDYALKVLEGIDYPDEVTRVKLEQSLAAAERFYDDSQFGESLQQLKGISHQNLPRLEAVYLLQIERESLSRLGLDFNAQIVDLKLLVLYTMQYDKTKQLKLLKSLSVEFLEHKIKELDKANISEFNLSWKDSLARSMSLLILLAFELLHNNEELEYCFYILKFYTFYAFGTLPRDESSAVMTYIHSILGKHKLCKLDGGLYLQQLLSASSKNRK